VYPCDLSCGYIPHPVPRISRKTVNESVDARVDFPMADAMEGKRQFSPLRFFEGTSIRFSNHWRPHQALGMKPPAEAFALAA